MAEGIRFNSESLDDDASSESDKDKKKKKKKAGNVGRAVVDGVVETKSGVSEKTVQTKQSLFEQLRGWLTDEPPKDKVPEKPASGEKPLEITSAKDIENLSVATSAQEEAAIVRARSLLAPESNAGDASETSEPAAPLENFRSMLGADELSEGEGVINLRGEVDPASPPENLTEEEIFRRSVEQDISVIETVESDDEAAAVQRAPQVLARAAPSGRRSRSRQTPPTAGPFPAGGGGAYNVFPPTPNTSPSQTGGNVLPASAGVSFGMLLAQRLALEAAHFAGRTRGRVEGTIAGLIIGGGIEHVRHKSRENKMTKKFKAEQQKQTKAVENMHVRTTQLEQHQNNVRETTKERLAYEERLRNDADSVIGARTSEAAATTKALAAEKARADSEKAKAELIERLNAQAAEQERLANEQLLKNPDSRIETSAWHAMEVDKSGHVVQDSAIEYGHEYYRERAHETGPKEQFDAKAGSAAVAAALLSGSTAASSQSGAMVPEPPSVATGLRTVQSSTLPPITGIDPSDYNADTDTPQFSATTIIPWIIVLVIIAITIAILM